MNSLLSSSSPLGAAGATAGRSRFSGTRQPQNRIMNYPTNLSWSWSESYGLESLGGATGRGRLPRRVETGMATWILGASLERGTAALRKDGCEAPYQNDASSRRREVGTASWHSMAPLCDFGSFWLSDLAPRGESRASNDAFGTTTGSFEMPETSHFARERRTGGFSPSTNLCPPDSSPGSRNRPQWLQFG